MASLIPYRAHLLLPVSPFSSPRTRNPLPFPLPQNIRFRVGGRNPLPFRGGSLIARMSLETQQLPSIEDARHLLSRIEGLLYTIADAAVSSSGDETAAAAEEATKKSGDWLSGITDYLETVLKVLKNGLSALHVPYSYGFAIILLTILVKGATFPLTKKQVESALAMRSLQPQVKAIQQLYAGDQERIQLETARLYKLAGVNPLAGCLPTLVTIPIWIGLYRALSNVANEGLLTEGFFWIPSLAGPTTIAARQSGGGTSWLFPFVDGHPPLGWSDTLAYLVLPILLILSQYISTQIMQPPQANDPSQQSSQVLTKILPLMIGYFALSVPSGLSLYWLTNNILSTGQQIWLQRLGGAKNPVKQLNEKIGKDAETKSMDSFSNFQKSLLDVEKENMISNTVKETSSGELRPGERFKQIKEKEKMRRKQREEEMKKKELAAKSSDEQQKEEIKLVEGTNENVSAKTEASENLPQASCGELNGTAGSLGGNGRNPPEGSQTEEATEMHASGRGTTSGDEAPNRRDQEIERGLDQP